MDPSRSAARTEVPLPPIMQAVVRSDPPELRDFWQSRLKQHSRDSYAGIPMSKFPEDLATYEHLIWERAPDIVLELGVFHGGSTLWFRDRLAALRRYRSGAPPRVIAVDIAVAAARNNVAQLGSRASEGIEFIEADLLDPRSIESIAASIPTGAEVLVIEDAAHDATVTTAALQGFAPLVRAGGYFVVEDTCVDVEELRGAADWPRGCGTALATWLHSDPVGQCFRRRPDLQAYGITCHPGGVLQRVEVS